MLLPAPQFIFVLIGNAFVVLLNVRYSRRQNVLMARMTEPFSEHNPSARSVVVLRWNRLNSYYGAFTALFLTVFAAIVFLPYGLDVWDPGYLGFWSDLDATISMAMTIGFFVLPGLFLAMTYSGELYVLTKEGIVNVRGKRKNEIRWAEVTDVQRYSGESGKGIQLKTGGRSLEIPDGLDDPLTFYAQALLYLPESLHGTEAYRWMGSKIGTRVGITDGADIVAP